MKEEEEGRVSFLNGFEKIVMHAYSFIFIQTFNAKVTSPYRVNVSPMAKIDSSFCSGYGSALHITLYARNAPLNFFKYCEQQ